MKRLSLAALAFAVLSCVALGAEKEVRTIYITFVAPESIEEMAAEADVVIHGKVLGSRSKAGTGALPVYTEHRLRIVDIAGGFIRPDRQQHHDEVIVLQQAGEVESEGTVIRIADEIPLATGAEYLLFLKWNEFFGRYQIWTGPFGVFKVERGTLHPSVDYRTVNGAKGKTVRQLREELRRAKEERQR